MSEPYQLRVVEEKADLDRRLKALTAFLNSTPFLMLDDHNQRLLLRQRTLMVALSDVLGERIAAFKAPIRHEI